MPPFHTTQNPNCSTNWIQYAIATQTKMRLQERMLQHNRLTSPRSETRLLTFTFPSSTLFQRLRSSAPLIFYNPYQFQISWNVATSYKKQMNTILHHVSVYKICCNHKRKLLIWQLFTSSSKNIGLHLEVMCKRILIWNWRYLGA